MLPGLRLRHFLVRGVRLSLQLAFNIIYHYRYLQHVEKYESDPEQLGPS